MAGLLGVFYQQKPDDVEFGGTCISRLLDGAKTPDFCILSDNDENALSRFKDVDGKAQVVGYPTVVVEVGYSEKLADLAKDCGRWIACSLGRVRMAIGINIDYKITQCNGIIEKRELEGVQCYIWEMQQIEIDNVTLNLEQKEKINQLWRADDNSGPATAYTCVSRVGESLYRFHAFMKHKYQV